MYVNTQARSGAAPVYNNSASAKQLNKQTAQQATGAINQDAAVFTCYDEKAARAAAVKDAILELQKNFSDINIVMSASLGKDSLSGVAAGLGSGLHLILSRDFIDRMDSSQEEYEKCTAQLKNILTSLSQNAASSLGSGAYVDETGVRFWQTDAQDREDASLAGYKRLHAMLDEMKKNVKQPKIIATASQASEKKLHTGMKSAYSVMGVYAGLANARTKAQVGAAMGRAQRKIGTIRTAARQGDSQERAQANAAIASCRTLLLRGRRKMRQLDQEAIATLREKQALKQANEAHMRKEAARIRAVRRSGDNAIASEGITRDMSALIRLLRCNEYESGRKDTSIYVAPYIPQLPVAAAAIPAVTSPASVPASVTVSATIAF